MSTLRTWMAASLVCLAGLGELPAQVSEPLLSKTWFEARTTHFHTYSCGVTQQVAKLAARLEQFRIAYEALAGTQGVSSPPIEVIALPDQESLKRYVPLYHDQPMNLSGFFHRGSDENLIVLSLADTGGGSLETIFHEYAHLLLRRNQRFWPMWLNEGMADIYGTFEVTGDHGVRIGNPQPLYLRILSDHPLLPLRALFAVEHDSADYNEKDRQGVFYAESWLLTHYLMVGSPIHRTHFSDLTTRLKKGETPEQAFTNAFGVSCSAMERELAQYQQLKRFSALPLSVRASLFTTQPMTTRGLARAETCFRLGDELLRVGRTSQAEAMFLETAKLAPASPLAYEGMGLLESERGRHQEALENLEAAVKHGSKSFLAHYLCAREKLMLNAPAPETFAPLPANGAADVKKELETALSIMPEFAPAHHLLGFFELLQGESLPNAVRHLRTAIDLEPENPGYLLTLAQVQIASNDPRSAQSTLESLCHSYVSGKLRAHAEEMLKSLPPLSR